MSWDLETIKGKTFDLWRNLLALNECVIPDSNDFETEIKQYGDLTDLATWEAAYSSLKAKFMQYGCLEDSQHFIEFYLIQGSINDDWQHLLPQVLEQLAMIPEAIAAVQRGLQKIAQYGREYGTTPEQIQQFREVVTNGSMGSIAGEQRRRELNPSRETECAGTAN